MYVVFIEFNLLNTQSGIYSCFSAETNNTQSISFWVHLCARRTHQQLISYRDTNFFANVVFLKGMFPYTKILSLL